MKPWAGVIGEDGVEVQRVYGVDSTSGTGGFLTPLTLHVYEFNWAPSSKEIAYIAADPPGENNWWIAQLWAAPVHIDATSVPEQPRSVFNPNTTKSALHGLQIAVPRYSPDGKRIALIGGLMSDQGSTGGDIWVVNSNGKGNPTDITPGIDGTPTWEVWLNDHTLGFVEDRRGHTLLTDADADKHTVVPNSSDDLGEVNISGGGPIKNAVSGSNNGLIAYVLSSYNKPSEIYVGAPGKATQFTHVNDATQLHPPRFESIEWENEGFHVQGWLTFPKDYDASKKYPLIVDVHGGPSASAGPRPETLWSEQGYFVLNPNPRGSFGQGEKFTAANRKDFGYGDLRDILKGMDTIEAKYPIDKNREGITGWSYGGFMTMFAVTQTTSLPRCRRRRRPLRLAELLRPELHRPVDDSLLRRERLRRPRRLRQVLRHHLHQEGDNADAHHRRRPRRRVPRSAELRDVARAQRPRRQDPARRLSGRRPRLPQPRTHPRPQRANDQVVRRQHARHHHNPDRAEVTSIATTPQPPPTSGATTRSAPPHNKDGLRPVLSLRPLLLDAPSLQVLLGTPSL